MLVVGNKFSGAVRRVVVGVVRLDEAVVGKLVAAAGILEVLKCTEELWLVLQEIDYFERRAGLVVVVKLAGIRRGLKALVDALVFLVPVENVHADLAE